jgi:hypothetical protein
LISAKNEAFSKQMEVLKPLLARIIHERLQQKGLRGV